MPVTVSCLLIALGLASPAVAGPYLDRQRRAPRVASALARRAAEVKQAFREAGAAWPPRIHLEVFKREGDLELWAAPAQGTRWVKVRTFPICKASGTLGPKRAQGDLQVPEGFYAIDRANPWSSFHLSLGIDYPNQVDRARNRRTGLGGDIFIHGNCVTVGCLPLQDGPIEDLYLAYAFARDGGQGEVSVHLFPCRFGEASCQAALERQPPDASNLALWVLLAASLEQFRQDGVPPRVVDQADGTYRILSPRT
jgi:murein L,D-transpeptidase YafK